MHIRIRPLVARELSANESIEWQYSATALMENTTAGVKVYSYDSVFAATSTNRDVYETMARPLVMRAMEAGSSVCLFTYGYVLGPFFSSQISDE